MNSGLRYAYATIEPGYPFVRYVDSDGDGVYETSETYDVDSQNKYTSEKDIQLIKNVFGEKTFTERLYLQKVELDRNGDTRIEFSEQYLGNNGKISSFDSDGDGVIDYEYIRYPDSADGKLVEETILEQGNISLHSEDGIPLSMRYGTEDSAVIPGYNENYYWISEQGTQAQETFIFNNIKDGITNGVVQIFQFDDELRFSVIRIGGTFFCRKLPPPQVQVQEK